MSQYYEELISIVEKYLGPVAKKFIDRHIEFHLRKSSEEITSEDLKRLSEWISMSIALLTSNSETAEKAKRDILILASN